MHILTVKSAYLGVCFLFLFLAYVTTQTYLTKLYKNVGFISFAAIYFPYAITSLISPFIGRKIGVKISILIGALTYVIWMSSVALNNYTFLIVASVINGIGCGLLWVHQGIYINKLIVEASIQGLSNVGRLTGIFFTLYSANLFIGSSLSILLLSNVNYITFIWVYFGVGVFAWILLFFLPWPHHNSWNILWNFLPKHTSSGVPEVFKQREEKKDPIPVIGPQSASSLVNLASAVFSAANIDINDRDQTPDEVIYKEEIEQGLNIDQINVTPVVKASIEIGLNKSETIKDHIDNLKRCIKLPGFIYLIPTHILLAFSVIFSYGTLPLLRADATLFETAGLFISYGFVSANAAFIWGRMYDYVGEKKVLCIGTSIAVFQYIILLIRMLYLPGLLPNWTWYIHSGLSGAIDIFLISLTNITISKKYASDDSPYLFAWYRFFYCLNFSIASWMNTMLPYWIMVIIVLILLIVMFMSYLLHIKVVNSNQELAAAP